MIINPTAGRGRAAMVLAVAREHFRARGAQVIEHFTAGPRDATRIVASLPDDATVVVVGGDGTLQDSAMACVGTKRRLGVIPAGSGDDFAFALGIGRHTPAVAVEKILRGDLRRVDTGTIEGQMFVNAAGTGFDAEVARQFLSGPRLLRERNAYLYAVLRCLGRLTAVPVVVELDGRTVHDGPALLVSAQNGPRSGGSFLLAPDADPADGLLDVVIAGDFSRIGTMRILPRVLAGTHLMHPQVALFRGRELSIHWRNPRPAHREGELMAPGHCYRIAVAPASLAVLA